MNKVFLKRALLILLGSACLLVAAGNGWEVYRLSRHRAEVKQDYSTLNNITYGLLSVNTWRDHLVNVVLRRIDDFEFTPEQEAALKSEISTVLHAVVNKADSMISKKQTTIGGKLKKFAVKTFVKTEKVHDQVPVFAQTIVNEIKKPKNKAKIKFLAESKLCEFNTITYDSTLDVATIDKMLQKYEAYDVESFNNTCQSMLYGLQKTTYEHAFAMLGMMVLVLLMWWLLRHHKELYTPLFVISVLLALLVLLVGLTSPMIEIDARIKEMSFVLMGETISFHDQVIFFQSKSIVDVVRILIETKKFDSILVGILILVFSILFPIGKLLATKLYLLGNEKWKSNKLINFFAFKSGKWSMADVNVIAIFMAYIGFNGIINSQLSSLNMKTDSLASISTNETSLQPGFILFVAFVLFGLILSVILQKITSAKVDDVSVVSSPESKPNYRPSLR